VGRRDPRAAGVAAVSTDPGMPDGPALDLLPARVTELGEGLTIRRALPTRGRRLVGAWCFLDHVGPLEHAAGGGLRVGPHPHIGLQTFTWMIEGELLHRDSLGVEQWIRPGQVNLMTAGAGIAHAEESPPGAGRVHAAQLWIALPEAQRAIAPAFAHHPQLPQLEHDGLQATLLVGEWRDLQSPVQVHSPLLGIDLRAPRAVRARLPLRADFEHAVLCLEGRLEVEDAECRPGALLWLGRGRASLALQADAGARGLLLGGAPFGEEVLMWWNFVARTPDEMVRATADWNAGRHFGAVPGTTLARLAAPDPSRLHLRAPG
jgi:redox-sensitive bicupin YhaK (pirin superfamily)